MGVFSNRLMRGACNRSYQRLAAEFGAGPASMLLAVALGHACYPKAFYGDKAFQDEIVHWLNRRFMPCCNAQTACGHVEQWLDVGTLSTESVFRRVWGLGPNEFIEGFMESGFGENIDSDQGISGGSTVVTTVPADVVQIDGPSTVRHEEPNSDKLLPAFQSINSDRQSDPNSIPRESSGMGLAMVIALSGVVLVGVILAVMAFVGIIGDPGEMNRAQTRDLSQPSHPEVRMWKDNTGNFATEAFLVGVSEDRVRLQKTNGKRIWVQIRRLSSEDKEWLRQAVAQNPSLAWTDQPSISESEPRKLTQVTEDAMFTLVTRDAIACVMRHVDRPFEAEFGKPLTTIDPDDPTIAYVCVQCNYQESGKRVSKLFFVVFENGRSPERAEISDDLICLLVNSDGKVLERDNAYWSELPIETQRSSGALNTNGPPWIAQTILKLNEAIPAESR